MVINRINFPIYKVMIISSIVVGMVYIYIMLRRENMPKKKLIFFLIFMLVMMILTAKLYTFIEKGFKTSFWKVGVSSLGAMLGIIVSAAIYEKLDNRNGIVIKYSILSLPLFYSFSKMACLFHGCCYGIPYSGPLAITYPYISSSSFFPVQLFEIIISMIVFIICNTYRHKKNIIYFDLFMIAMWKFLFEFLRSSHIGVVLSANQIFSILLMIVTIVIYLRTKKNES